MNGLMSGLMFGALIELPFGSIGGLIARACDAPAHTDFRLRSRITEFRTEFSSRSLTEGPMFGLILGLMLGLVIGPAVTRTCWLSFIVVSLWMGVRRLLPFAPMGFLDDAYRLGLLWTVGRCISSATPSCKII